MKLNPLIQFLIVLLNSIEVFIRLEQNYYKVTMTQPKQVSNINISAADMQPSSGQTGFYPRNAMLAWAWVPAMALCLSKRLNESSWVLVWELPSTYPTLC